MPASVNASQFTLESIAASANPRPPSVAGGVPISTQRMGAGAVSSMRRSMAATDLLSSENVASNGLETNAILTLEALSVKIEVDSNPGLSLLDDNKDLNDNPNIINPQAALEVNALDDGSTMFPMVADPWHEMDDAPSQYILDEVEKSTAAANATHQATNATAILQEIYSMNTNPAMPDAYKMKQLKEQ